MRREQTAGPDVRNRLIQAGFEVDAIPTSRGSITVRKHNCVCNLELQPDNSWALLGPPRFIIRGMDCALEDCGYQKFWRHQEARFPIRKADLEALHRFDDEIRAILRLRTLYNEALGSTCAQTVYDRLGGRPDR